METSGQLQHLQGTSEGNTKIWCSGWTLLFFKTMLDVFISLCDWKASFACVTCRKVDNENSQLLRWTAFTPRCQQRNLWRGRDLPEKSPQLSVSMWTAKLTWTKQPVSVEAMSQRASQPPSGCRKISYTSLLCGFIGLTMLAIYCLSDMTELV